MYLRTLLLLLTIIGAADAMCCPSTATSSATNKALDAVKNARYSSDIATAEKLLEPVLKADPDNVRALYTQGLIHIDKKEFADAEASVSKAAQIQQECAATITSPDYSVYNTLGWVQMIQGKNKEAEDNYLKAIKQIGASNPQSLMRANSNLGYLYFAEGRFADARPYLSEASAAGSKGAETTLKQLTDAQAQYDKAIAPRVFVQVSDHAPKETGQAAIQTLKALHYNVPDLQIVNLVPNTDEVRYFHDDDKARAEALALQLTTANLGKFNVKDFVGKTPGVTVPEKQFEVWFANGKN
ncbi:tetratricopeptide repeat protein [Pseudolysobacter antarcticus]|uniref:Tetratricopeptide repeat protein n=1 Tax=Pseudolysobacter antarcticus TaxID=2511995 RepID=A0A411HG42_9GAMM|nr:tetratricopeptide repeat protein [Pseudolysobacter antarcticus]QBB69462.1 tetratricopeptide repeat protein [Pseudolysobacter antarcticus]